VRATLSLLRLERRARWFFLVLAQSSLGTGAAHVALLLIAYERFRSPWAVSLVLLADVVPAMLLGPLLGAAADRWPRKACAVVADVLRAGAFLGIALMDPFAATVGFALLAGVGNALFKPAVLSGLPSLVASERAAAATSLYGAITDFGYTVGPALTAGALLLVDP
jgi:MFS family permease